ncbi:MAG: DUF2249 domain-containing protein [Acidimicrobiia bacterium]|nr:DUF2249 domain-containing protein [Acidimicrobiia bacterium]
MPVLDLRELPPPQRHPLVYEHLNSLTSGEELELVNDHKPSPLRYEMEATRPGEFTWEDGDDGPEVWSARIRCTARIVDARPTIAEGKEPFDEIMAAAAEVEPGGVLVIFAPSSPSRSRESSATRASSTR